MSLPTFDNLPLDPNGPPGNAWGLFGPANNDLGMLNLLTPETVRQAATEEIRDGVRISLDLPLNRVRHSSFNRKPFVQELINKAPRFVNDDVLTFNTQTSTQWDGFRHYGNQTHGCYFNGHCLEELKSSGTRPGDILFIRTGFTAAFNALTPAQEEELGNRPTPSFAGIENGEAMLRWLWENQFAAVASDTPSLEPAPIKHERGMTLHEWCLAGWGMPIGEYFDLEELATYCREKGRWGFFLCSVPLKVPGGVASPPNAVAIL
ncbi:uncharacterized protein BO87DRAFT_423329 [Aspergillus neoniger CBS 115656]|uniref:Cyclase n=1 Tax=Aspergillus neoniger (strain CBS 115656) TaxID=1448310 RepID=A0A318YQJ9_ASPNB|nr:hypothetical protein BO87DRAFT_423329 [Aspergillus neoniger CBS 115656]PYH36995.1 hypothetical protein BO87DRAFT_423329 [Aspergillus neoniger CBS 115656]